MSLIETHDETKPAGSRDRSLGDDDIREHKREVRERSDVGHVRPADESGESNVGHHRSIKLVVVETVDPTNEANSGWIYLKDIDGKAEAHFEDEDGNVIVLTKAGKLAVLGSEGWRSGDMLLSSSEDTPNGWTNVSTTYDNKFIRIGDDAPLTTGGSDTHDHGAVTGSHVLTVPEIPAHTHTYDAHSGGAVTGNGGNSNILSDGDATGSTGGGGGHTHTIASANNVPAYIQLRMYEKD